MLKFVKIVTYYAPIAFFAILQTLSQATARRSPSPMAGRCCCTTAVCCVHLYGFPAVCLVRRRQGSGQGMFRHIAKPAITSLGTCSSVATIPTNVEEARDTGIDEDVANMVCPLGATHAPWTAPASPAC